MLSLLAFLLIGLVSLASPLPASAEREHAARGGPWLTVLDDGRRLRLEREHTIRFEGTGRLEFGVDRRRVSVEAEAPPRVFVSGTRVRGRRTLTSDEALELVAPGVSWKVRLVSDEEARAFTDAVRIRDDQPDSPARLDTDEPTVFFLRIDEHGGSTFIYPETTP